MKFFKVKEDPEIAENCRKGAELVKELYETSRWVRSEENKQKYEDANKWFMETYNCVWTDCVKKDEKSR